MVIVVLERVSCIAGEADVSCMHDVASGSVVGQLTSAQPRTCLNINFNVTSPGYDIVHSDYAATMPEPYAYQPLGDNEIRVLVLFLGRHDDPLQGYQEVCQLEDPYDYDGTEKIFRKEDEAVWEGLALSIRLHRPSPDEQSRRRTNRRYKAWQARHDNDYYAISYAWGPAVFNHSLRLTGSDLELQITESLHSALRRFSREDSIIRVWADAICINQADVQERNQQVNIMACIYRTARRVLVWLGEAEESDTTTFWFMQTAASSPTKDDGRRSWLSERNWFDESYMDDLHACKC
jgi:hypothetical protein